MSETHDKLESRLSEFVDGTLADTEQDAVEEHLAQCGSCRAELEGLRAVLERAQGLRTMSPPRDLWPGIAAAIQAPLGLGTAESQVIKLPTARWGVGRKPGAEQEPMGALTVTRSQLAAAATILVVVSAATTWWVGPGVPERGTIATVPVPSAAQMVSAELPGASEGLSAELKVLEESLAGVSASLDPETVRVLQKNLGVIERAIEDLRRALALDPANEFLGAHLERAYQRKLSYLKDATEIASWSS